MQNHFPLISLFQQHSSTNNKGSGFKYRLGGTMSQDLDVPLDSMTDFTDQILSYINDSNYKFIEDSEKFVDNEDNFDRSNYGPVLLEKIDKCMTPVIADVRFEFTDNSGVNFYHDKFIYQCVHKLQDILLGLFNIPRSIDGFNKALTCFVMEAGPWTKGEKQFFNVRFQFPFTRINIDHLNRVVIKKFREFVVSRNIIKELLHQIPLNISDIIPEIGEYISMYGCKQKIEDAPLILRGVYSYIADINNLEDDYEDETTLPFYVNYNIAENEIDEEDMDDATALSMKFSIKENALIKSKYIEEICFDDYDRLHNLPLILSVHFCTDVIKLDDNVDLSPEQPIPQPKYVEGAAANTSLDKFQMLNRLMPMISKHRFVEYYKHDWTALGKAIHTIYNGNPAGLTIFEHYTDDIYMKSLCEEEYAMFSSEILDIRTIRHYANVDNSMLYDEFTKELYWDKILPALSCQELDFAKFACEIICLQFVYDRNNDVWYFFDGTRLVKDTKAYMLIDYISSVKNNPGNDKIIKAIYAFKDDASAKGRACNDRFSKSNYDAYEKGANALIKKLSSLAFVNKVIAALQVCMYDDYLYNKTDENPLLTACKDCVFECFDDKIFTRPGKLQDYVTKSTNISFPSTFTITHPKVKFMLRYYSQVHTDPELCHFFLKTLASLLKGGNDEKFFINWIGEANASKSQVLKFVQAALGDYCIAAFPNHVITVNMNANTGKPEPALERAKGARVVFAAETDRSEKWHVGHVKKFTSGDDYDNRTLNKEGGQRSASFQLIAMSNIDLDAPNADEAYYSRYVKIPFGSKWVDNAPLDEAEQIAQRRFPIDLTFSSKIKYYGQAQLWLMYHYYPIYKKEGIRTLPAIVKQVTMKHQRDLDVIFNFTQDRLEKFFIGDPKDKLPDKTKSSSVGDLHRVYRAWYRQAYGNDVQPLDQYKFRDEMVRRIGDVDADNNWYGILPKPIKTNNSL